MILVVLFEFHVIFVSLTLNLTYATKYDGMTQTFLLSLKCPIFLLFSKVDVLFIPFMFVLNHNH